jgi:hypothetical protein
VLSLIDDSYVKHGKTPLLINFNLQPFSFSFASLYFTSSTAHSPTMSTGLTDLPLEIRQQIFGDYFKVPGGYVYDGQSDKLRNADNTLPRGLA